MMQPTVTLTDYLLFAECALFAVILARRGAATLNRLFAWLFAALAAASLFGGSYHGFFEGGTGSFPQALWLATLMAVGLMTFFNWLIAGRIQCGPAGRRVVTVIAVVQLVGFVLWVFLQSRDFMWASFGTIPAMVFLLIGYFRASTGGDRRILFGLLGLLLAFVGAALQQLKIGIHPDYFNHNALYHMVEFVAFIGIFLSIPGLVERARAGSG